MSSSITIRALYFALPLAGLLVSASSVCCSALAAEFAPACPSTGILRDAADLTLFRGAGSDLTDMVVDGRITGLGGKCALDDTKHLRTKLNVNFEVARGPADADRTAEVTYFVSVSRGQTILAKQEYRVKVQFPGNTERLRLQGEEIDVVLPVDDKTTGEAYTVLAGFQLSPEQLAFNRSRGVR